MTKKDNLDAYEQDLEDDFEILPVTKNKNKLINELQAMAKKYLQKRKKIISIEELNQTIAKPGSKHEGS